MPDLIRHPEHPGIAVNWLSPKRHAPDKRDDLRGHQKTALILNRAQIFNFRAIQSWKNSWRMRKTCENKDCQFKGARWNAEV